MLELKRELGETVRNDRSDNKYLILEYCQFYHDNNVLASRLIFVVLYI